MVHPYSSQIHPDAARNWLSEQGERDDDDGVFLLSSSFSRASELIERMKNMSMSRKRSFPPPPPTIRDAGTVSFESSYCIYFN